MDPYKKNSEKNVCFKTNETTKSKNKLSDLIKKTKTMDIFKRNGIQIKGKDNNILNISVDKKNSIELSKTNSQIKKTKSSLENNIILSIIKDNNTINFS